MKKRVWSVLLALALALALAACGGGNNGSGGSGEAVPGNSGGGDAQETYNLKFSIEGSESIRMSQLWRQWADMVTEKTGGRVQFTFYYDSTLLDPNGEYEQLRAGIADIADMHKYAADGFVILEKWKGLTLGTPIPAQSKMGKTLFEEFPVLQEEVSGVKVLAHAFDGGSYQLLTVNKPVSSVADMKGLVIWCEADFNDYFTALGATPVNTPWSEVYSSLQKNMYDGLFIAAETLQSVNFAEVCKYCTMVNLNYLAAPGHLMNLDTWNSFPDDIKAVFDDPEVVGFIENALEESSHTSEAEGIAWAVENRGTTIIELTEEAQQEFVDVLNQSKASMAEAFDAQGLPGTELVEAIVRHSEEYK
nr:TRAP transporter substrate-binding protein DctP [uncultured Oscillibacter sp.]